MTTTDYNQQAEAFLERFGIKFRCTLSDSKVAPWDGFDGAKRWGNSAILGLGVNSPAMMEARAKPRHHYRVTLSRNDPAVRRESWKPLKRIVFDFWGSIADAEKGIHPTAYDVLACISSDTYCAESFKEWAGEFGESTDSIRALQTYRRCAAFAKRLNQFFTAEEVEALREIQ